MLYITTPQKTALAVKHVLATDTKGIPEERKSRLTEDLLDIESKLNQKFVVKEERDTTLDSEYAREVEFSSSDQRGAERMRNKKMKVAYHFNYYLALSWTYYTEDEKRVLVAVVESFHFKK